MTMKNSASPPFGNIHGCRLVISPLLVLPRLPVPEHPGRAWLRVADPRLAMLWDRAAPYYRAHAHMRPYHNTAHANRVASATFLLASVPSSAQLLAARWHDAVYVPGSPLNEQCSAEALHYHAHTLGLGADALQVVHQACVLIRGTTVERHSASYFVLRGTKHADLTTLLDADLCSLADPWRTFVAHQHHLAREQLGPIGYAQIDARAVALDRGARWLCNTLGAARQHIYYTPHARHHWEERARANIRRWHEVNQAKIEDTDHDHE